MANKSLHLNSISLSLNTKKMKQSNHVFKKSAIAILLIVFGFTVNCNREKTNTYKRLEEYLNTINIVNTHEHQRNPSDLQMNKHNFYSVLNFSYYLKADLVSAGAPELSLDIIENHNLDELWDMYGQYLSFSCNTTFYRQFLYGFQALYDFDDFYFTKDNIQYLSTEIAKNYNNYDSWFDTAFKKTGYTIMFNDQVWNRFNTNINDKYFALVLDIWSFLTGISNRPSVVDDSQIQNELFRIAKEKNFTIESLDDYLGFT
ncbi:hypothetical protein ES705_32953 [subsurface metagenome]